MPLPKIGGERHQAGDLLTTLPTLLEFAHVERNLLLNQPEIRLHLSFSERTDVRLVPNQLENGKYNLISG